MAWRKLQTRVRGFERPWQAPFTTQELLARVDSAHLCGLNSFELSCLDYLSLGYSAADIAALTHSTRSTVNRRFLDMMDRTLVPAGIPPTHAFLRTLRERHVPCCFPALR